MLSKKSCLKKSLVLLVFGIFLVLIFGGLVNGLTCEDFGDCIYTGPIDGVLLNQPDDVFKKHEIDDPPVYSYLDIDCKKCSYKCGECGDGEINPPEQCDDGLKYCTDDNSPCNSPDDCGTCPDCAECLPVSGDGCSADCLIECDDDSECPDGAVCEGGSGGEGVVF